MNRFAAPTRSWPDGDRTAPSTPWGPAQYAYQYAPGVVFYSTAGHGGIKVSPGAAKNLSGAARKEGMYWGGAFWYEEDVDANIPLYEVPAWLEAFNRLGGGHLTKETLLRGLQSYHKVYLQRVQEGFSMPSPPKVGDIIEFQKDIRFGGYNLRKGQKVQIIEVSRSAVIFTHPAAPDIRFKLRMQNVLDGDVTMVGESTPRLAYTRYQGDPYWMNAKFPGRAQDGTPVKKGDKILYWPRTKTIMVGKAAEDAWRKFQSEAADEDFYNRAAGRMDFHMPRPSYLPPAIRGTDPFVPPGTDLAFWSWEENGKLYGIAFQGKADKPLWNFRFLSDAQRQQRIKDTIDTRKMVLQKKQEAQQAKREYQHGLQVGDILYSSWGYDQTNVDFYQVVAVVGKQVAIREIASKVVSGDAFSENVAAVKGSFIGPPEKKIPQMGYNGEPYIKVNSVANAYKWNGKPQYQSGPHGGH